MWGKEVSATLVRKEMKKNFTCVPVNASNGSRGTWEA